MAWHTVAELLAGSVPAGTAVTVKGWVRTRRDSKAGLSFLHVHDGTCFDPIQVGGSEHAARTTSPTCCG